MRMAHEWQIKQRLGVPKKLPAEFSFGPKLIVVTPYDEQPAVVALVGVAPRREGKTHRTYALCPACHEIFSMGRLNQHYPCKDARKVLEGEK